MSAMRTLGRLPGWMREVGAWISAGRLGWAAVLAPFAVLLCFWFVLPCWEPRIRLSGMVLELAGLLTVAWGLGETRKHFHQPSLFAGVRAYITRFPSWRRHIVLRAEAAAFLAAGSSTMTGRVTTSQEAGTIEDRVTFLEKQVARLSTEQLEINRKFTDAERKHEASIQSESEKREVGDAHTRKQLEEAVAGGLHLEMTGAAWILVGIVLATASNEIASASLFAACSK